MSVSETVHVVFSKIEHSSSYLEKEPSTMSPEHQEEINAEQATSRSTRNSPPMAGLETEEDYQEFSFFSTRKMKQETSRNMDEPFSSCSKQDNSCENRAAASPESLARQSPPLEGLDNEEDYQKFSLFSTRKPKQKLPRRIDETSSICSMKDNRTESKNTSLLQLDFSLDNSGTSGRKDKPRSDEMTIDGETDVVGERTLIKQTPKPSSYSVHDHLPFMRETGEDEIRKNDVSTGESMKRRNNYERHLSGAEQSYFDVGRDIRRQEDVHRKEHRTASNDPYTYPKAPKDPYPYLPKSTAELGVDYYRALRQDSLESEFKRGHHTSTSLWDLRDENEDKNWKYCEDEHCKMYNYTEREKRLARDYSHDLSPYVKDLRSNGFHPLSSLPPYALGVDVSTPSEGSSSSSSSPHHHHHTQRLSYYHDYYSDRQQFLDGVKKSLHHYYDPYGLTSRDFADTYLRQKLYENYEKMSIEMIDRRYTRDSKESNEVWKRSEETLYRRKKYDIFMKASSPVLFRNVNEAISLEAARAQIMCISNRFKIPSDSFKRSYIHPVANIRSSYDDNTVSSSSSGLSVDSSSLDLRPARMETECNEGDANLFVSQSSKEEETKRLPPPSHRDDSSANGKPASPNPVETKYSADFSSKHNDFFEPSDQRGDQCEMETETKTNDSKQIVCSICSKTFNRSSNLYTHMRTHSPNKPHACDFCGKRFHQKADLRIHRYIHTGEKPHKCTKCGRGFKQLTHLKYHLRTHSEVRMYKCTYCEKGFNQKSNLQAHIFGHTGQRPHRCDVCGKGFTLASTLNTHKRTHLPSKPFKCDYCEKAFYQKNALKMHHMSTHPFSSGACVL